jgi:hypothetical protein
MAPEDLNIISVRGKGVQFFPTKYRPPYSWFCMFSMYPLISAHILEHDCTSYPESPLSHSTISLDQFRLILTALCPHIRRDFPTGHMKSLSCSGYIRSSEKILSAEFFWLSCGHFVVILAIIFAELSAGDAEPNLKKLCIFC